MRLFIVVCNIAQILQLDNFARDSFMMMTAELPIQLPVRGLTSFWYPERLRNPWFEAKALPTLRAHSRRGHVAYADQRIQQVRGRKPLQRRVCPKEFRMTQYRLDDPPCLAAGNAGHRAPQSNRKQEQYATPTTSTALPDPKRRSR